MSKLYSCDIIDDMIFLTKKHIEQELYEQGIERVEAFEAKMEVGGDGFWCNEFQEVGMNGEYTCGKICDKYAPRNGKSGRCRHHRNCYEMTDKKVTIKAKNNGKDKRDN